MYPTIYLQVDGPTTARPVRMDPDRWCVTCGALMRAGIPCDRQSAHQRIRATRSAISGTVFRRSSSRYTVRATYSTGTVHRWTVAALSHAEAVHQLADRTVGAERVTATRVAESWDRTDGPVFRPFPTGTGTGCSVGTLLLVMEHQHRHDRTIPDPTGPTDMDAVTWPLAAWIPTYAAPDTGGRGAPVYASIGTDGIGVPLWPMPAVPPRHALPPTVDVIDGTRHRRGAAWTGSDGRVHGPAVDGPQRGARGVTVHPHASPTMTLDRDASEWWAVQRTTRRREADGSRPRRPVGPPVHVLIPVGPAGARRAREAAGAPTTATARRIPRRTDAPRVRPVMWSGPAHALVVGLHPVPLVAGHVVVTVPTIAGPLPLPIPPSVVGAVVGTTAVVTAGSRGGTRSVGGRVRSIGTDQRRTAPVPTAPVPTAPVPTAPVPDQRRVNAAIDRRRERMADALAVLHPVHD